MDRKEFIASLGFSAASLMLASCLGGCSKDNGSNPAPSGVNFTVDLSLPANAPLAENGGYIYSNGIIIAKTISGTYVAVSQSCTHEGQTVVYQSTQDRFYCPRHGATFNDSGSVTNGPASMPLKQYSVVQNGNVLTISG